MILNGSLRENYKVDGGEHFCDPCQPFPSRMSPPITTTSFHISVWVCWSFYTIAGKEKQHRCHHLLSLIRKAKKKKRRKRKTLSYVWHPFEFTNLLFCGLSLWLFWTSCLWILLFSYWCVKMIWISRIISLSMSLSSCFYGF
jgi:hypothetical protein